MTRRTGMVAIHLPIWRSSRRNTAVSEPAWSTSVRLVRKAQGAQGRGLEWPLFGSALRPSSIGSSIGDNSESYSDGVPAVV
jgi:hypothetical protein